MYVQKTRIEHKHKQTYKYTLGNFIRFMECPKKLLNVEALYVNNLYIYISDIYL
jgi:hypothetical protein